MYENKGDGDKMSSEKQSLFRENSAIGPYSTTIQRDFWPKCIDYAINRGEDGPNGTAAGGSGDCDLRFLNLARCRGAGQICPCMACGPNP